MRGCPPERRCVGVPRKEGGGVGVATPESEVERSKVVKREGKKKKLKYF